MNLEGFGAYLDEQREKQAAVEGVLRRLLPDIAKQDGPIKGLTCPRNHLVRRVRLEGLDGYDDGGPLRLSLLPGASRRRSGAMASSDSPPAPRANAFDALMSVDEDMSDQIVQEARRSEEIGDESTRFTCRQCKPTWSDRFTTAWVMKLYATAVAISHDTIPLTGRAHRKP